MTFWTMKCAIEIYSCLIRYSSIIHSTSQCDFTTIHGPLQWEKWQKGQCFRPRISDQDVIGIQFSHFLTWLSFHYAAQTSAKWSQYVCWNHSFFQGRALDSAPTAVQQGHSFHVIPGTLWGKTPLTVAMKTQVDDSISLRLFFRGLRRAYILVQAYILLESFALLTMTFFWVTKF